MAAVTWEPIAAVPADLRWKPITGHFKRKMTLVSSPGGYYKIVRSLIDGSVQYFKKSGADEPASPKDKIDAEPTKGPQVRYPKGRLCWFVGEGGLWYACEVVERKQDPDRIVLRPATGWDAERKVAWPYGELLEFPAKANNPLFQRLRPLKARVR